jgi:predicted nuclease of predicted toxin-antitoxin system
MRFIIDQPVSPMLAEWLRRVGHDAYHVRDRHMSAASDTDIFETAVREERIIITADLDFTRIVALTGRDRPGVVLFRAGNITDEQMLALLQEVLTEVPAERLIASVTTIDRFRIRVSAAIEALNTSCASEIAR